MISFLCAGVEIKREEKLMYPYNKETSILSSAQKARICHACAVVMLFIVVFTMAFSMFVVPQVTFALTADDYSDVMTDLTSDSSFDTAKFPEDSKDRTIKVIQIAESENNNLYIYTYEPCKVIKSLKACKVNMSLSEDVDGTKLYDLILLSKEGVFAKYLVKDLVVNNKDFEERNYNISTIYRSWIPGVDKRADSDENVVNTVAYPVGQVWTAKTVDNDVKYSVYEVEYVTVTSQMIGMRRYTDGFQFASTKVCDAHYLAFSCDHDIDYIQSAKIAFNTTDYTKLEGSDYKYADPVKREVELEKYQVASNDGSGWFGKKEDWHRIQSTSNFINEVNMSSETEKAIISRYDWILNFYETSYERAVGGKDILIATLVPLGFIGLIVDACTTRGTVVSDVTLLRLQFSYDGEIYDMGVVADSQTGTNKPTNPKEQRDNIREWFKDLLKKIGKMGFIIIACVSAVVLIVVLLTAILPRIIPQRVSYVPPKRPTTTKKKPAKAKKRKPAKKAKKRSAKK